MAECEKSSVTSLLVGWRQQDYLVKVLLAERSSKMSFLELPLLVTFIHNRISCRTAVQSGFAGTIAPNDPVKRQTHALVQVVLACTCCQGEMQIYSGMCISA